MKDSMKITNDEGRTLEIIREQDGSDEEIRVRMIDRSDEQIVEVYTVLDKTRASLVGNFLLQMSME